MPEITSLRAVVFIDGLMRSTNSLAVAISTPASLYVVLVVMLPLYEFDYLL